MRTCELQHIGVRVDGADKAAKKHEGASVEDQVLGHDDAAQFANRGEHFVLQPAEVDHHLARADGVVLLKHALQERGDAREVFFAEEPDADEAPAKGFSVARHECHHRAQKLLVEVFR